MSIHFVHHNILFRLIRNLNWFLIEDFGVVLLLLITHDEINLIYITFKD